MDALQPEDPLRVGDYVLLRRLGAGGMGRVYLGRSAAGRLVAVKVIRPELAGDQVFRRRFAQEVVAGRQVGGSFTERVLDADPDDGQPWLVTEYVAGLSLADVVRDHGALPAAAVRTLAAGLAEGLRAVHAAGIVHRDLKPSNVLLTDAGPRIIDFGICCAASGNGPGGRVTGSPGFMSPEQAASREAGPPSDIFSLGGVLAFAATGRPPFGTGPVPVLVRRVRYGTAALGHVPAELRPLIERCLAKDPAARPTAEWLAAQIGRAEPGRGWLPHLAAALPDGAARYGRLHRRRAPGSDRTRPLRSRRSPWRRPAA